MNEKQQTAARIIVFVGLTWLVLLITPRIFGPPPGPAPTTTVAPTDSAARPADTTTAATGRGSVPSMGAARDTVPAAVSVPVESVTVSDSLSEYQFSNVGAAVVRAELLKHRRLSQKGSAIGNVQLVRDDEALLRYHFIFGRGDTLSLNDTPFEAEQVRNAAGQLERVRYSTTLPGTGGRLTIEYVPVPNSYTMQVNGRLEGVSGPAFLLAQLPSGLRSGEADPNEDLLHYAVAYKPTRADAQGVGFAKINPRETARTQTTSPISWVAVKSKYFIVGLLKPPADSGFMEVRAIGGTRTTSAATHVDTYAIDDVSDGAFSFEIYAGPQEFRRLVALGRDFQNSNPYGGYLQPIVQPFAVLVMRALLWLKDTTKLEYGWVLVLFGVLIRVLLWPLNQKALRTTLRMQRIQPELTNIQTKYKDNPQRQQEEILRIYKEHGMTPFSPLAGCLPMFIPLPVLFALFFVFQNTIEFRGVPFLWLPDISLKDPTYIVPIVMGISWLAGSWVSSRGVPSNPQMKIMSYGLPVVFTFLFANWASGINLYYAVQNIASIPQQWLVARERAKQAATMPAPASKTAPKGKGKS